MNDIDDLPPNDERQGDSRQAGSLVGREAEVDRLRSFLATAGTQGGALLVTGEPGVGKTGLLDAASDHASAAGTRILHAAGIQFEAGMSYSGLNQVLLPLLDELPQLPAVHRDALNVALGFGEGVPPSRLVVSNAALVLLRDSAADRPLLVILDDLPWLDRASADVLSFVARRLDGTKVGLIGASRTGEEDFFDHAGLPEVVVEPLDDVASRQLLETRFPDLGRTVRERILVEAQGNPLALLELPVELGPGRRASVALPSTLPLGRRLQALFGSRTTALPPRTRQLLLRMALDGTGDARVLEAGAGSNAGFRDLAPAEEARLAYLDETAHRLAFHHPLIRSTVVELSHAEERRAAHRVLADAWADQPERRALHLGEATVEPDEAVAAQLEAAAARILARGDAVGCVKALTRASELSPGTADRRRRLAAAAYIGAEVAGELSNASQVLAELRRGDTEVDGSLQAAVAASAFLLQGDGDVATAHRLLVGALDSREGILDARDPVLAEALYSLMMVCSYGGSEELWQPFEAALARSDGIPVALDLSSKTFADPARSGEALEALESAVSALADEADPTQIIRIGTAAAYVDRMEGCRDALWRVVNDARHGGAVASGIIALVTLAADDVKTGRWDEAEQLVHEVIEVCELHGYGSVTWPGRYLQAVVAAARGDHERTQELTDGLVQWGGPRGIRVGQWWAWQARGLAALGRGDFEEAYQAASRISPPGVLAPHVPFALYVLMDLVEAAVRTDRRAEAMAHVAAMQEADLARLSSRLALVVGGSAAMAAPDDSALALFQETLALPGIERWQFDLARVRLACGERLRRNGAMIEARAQLNAALEIFERLRARQWVERTTAELRATGQTKPRAGEDVLDRLTPQEFEIATLAASGMTNKQIAERLFLSHRTIGGHLHRAFPKLGVATRAALRDALESLSPEQLPRS
jgi:DNA-binding CsgD family transcriptional regulator/tetratricopeptide (TPR) repeat protein